MSMSIEHVHDVDNSSKICTLLDVTNLNTTDSLGGGPPGVVNFLLHLFFFVGAVSIYFWPLT